MKKQIILSLAIFLLIVSLVAADNVATLNRPTSTNATVSGATYILNATVNSGSVNLTDATFYYQLSGGSTWTVIIANNTNDTELAWAYTWNSSLIGIDAVGVTFNVTIGNATIESVSNITTAVMVDNGDPAADWGSGSIATGSNVNNMDPISFVTGADPNRGISNCTINMGGQTEEITASGNACSLSKTLRGAFGITTAGTYSYDFVVFDANGNQTTVGTNRTLVVAITPGGGGSSGGGVTPTTPDVGITEQSFFGEGRAAGKSWFSATVDSIVKFFRSLFS